MATAHGSNKLTASSGTEPPSKVCIITGANTGIGFEVAKFLSSPGDEGAPYHVIMACRDVAKAEAAIKSIVAVNTNYWLTFLQLDISSRSSIRKFVEEFKALNLPLHALINNAGIFLHYTSKEKKYTPDDMELTIATNHLGPVLLTYLLLEDLVKTKGSVINVVSTLHNAAINTRMGQAVDVNFDDLAYKQDDDRFTGYQAYKDSKSMQVMFTYELSRQLENSGVTVNCLCPGFIPTTELGRNSSAFARFFLRYVLGGLFKSLGLAKQVKTIDHGRDAVVDLVLRNEHGTTGKYFSDREIAESSEETRDIEKQKKCWEVTCKTLGLPEDWKTQDD